MRELEVFPFGHMRKAGSNGQITLRNRKAQFGDGYSQRVKDGLNNKVASWPMSFEGNEAELAPIVDFFDRHEGALSFLWTPPFSAEPKRFVVETYAVNSIGGGVYSVRADFTEVFSP